jgi:hypothetical protein
VALARLTSLLPGLARSLPSAGMMVTPRLFSEALVAEARQRGEE